MSAQEPRWASVPAREWPNVGQDRHLVVKGAETSVCGVTALPASIWRGQTTKPRCRACVERARGLGIDFPESAEAFLDLGPAGTLVTVKTNWYETPTITVGLVEVHGQLQVWWKGHMIGTVRSYEGSRDRPTYGGRLRRPGKRRKLWHYRSRHLNGDLGEGFSGQESRAECIRQLVQLWQYRTKDASL